MTLRERLLQEIAAKADEFDQRYERSGLDELELARWESHGPLQETGDGDRRAAAIACAAWALLALEALDGALEQKHTPITAASWGPEEDT